MTLPLVFFLEEESMKAALERIVPRVLPAAHCTYITHQGKQDLEKSIDLEHNRSSSFRNLIAGLRRIGS